MTTKFATYGGWIWESTNEQNEDYFEISDDDERRVTLRAWQYSSDFLANKGDIFYQHNELLYIKTKKGEIISCDNYIWNNTLIRDCYSTFGALFGNPVKATQINNHHHLTEVA